MARNRTKTLPRSYIYYLTIRHYSIYFAMAFLGVLIWTLTYLLFAFFKEILICYLRRNDKFTGRAYYYKFIEYKPHFKNLYAFTGILFLFWIVIIFIIKDWRYYVIILGFYLFISGYIICWSIYYLFITRKKCDYFDEIKWIYNYIKQNYFSKNTTIKHKYE